MRRLHCPFVALAILLLLGLSLTPAPANAQPLLNALASAAQTASSRLTVRATDDSSSSSQAMGGFPWSAAASARPGGFFCRMDQSSQHSFCGLPYELSNFQGGLRLAAFVYVMHICWPLVMLKYLHCPLPCHVTCALLLAAVNCSQAHCADSGWMFCTTGIAQWVCLLSSVMLLLLLLLRAGHFKCDKSVIVGRPADRQQLANLVKVRQQPPCTAFW
jgi:hypothetical protein